MSKVMSVFKVVETPSKKTGENDKHWYTVAVAFSHAEGGGFNIEIPDGVALTGKLVVLPPKKKTGKT